MTTIITIPAPELEALADRHGLDIEFDNARGFAAVRFGSAVEYRADLDVAAVGGSAVAS